MTASWLHMTGTRTLFLALTVLALSVLLRPVCNAAHPHMHASEPASCCQNIGGTGDAKPLGVTADGAAKPLVSAAAFAYVAATVLFLLVAVPRANAAPPPRSFYARSSRILR